MANTRQITHIEFADLLAWFKENVAGTILTAANGEEFSSQASVVYRHPYSDEMVAIEASSALGFRVTKYNIAGVRKVRFGRMTRGGGSTGAKVRLQDLEDRVSALEAIMAAARQEGNDLLA